MRLKEVKDTYEDVDEYLDTFEPLLFEEVKAQIVQGKDEEEGVVFYFPHCLSFFLIKFSFVGL